MEEMYQWGGELFGVGLLLPMHLTTNSQERHTSLLICLPP